MAKGKVTDTGGRSNKVRVVMMDAELSDQAVTDLSNVLLNAFKPLQVRIIDRKAMAAGNGTANGHQQELGLVEEPSEETEEEEQTEDSTQVVSPSKPRKLPLPAYLHDLDTTGDGTSLKDFVEAHQSKKHLRRYLAASYWLKHHGKHESVNADKMYSVYRNVGWQPNINDWDSNFRSLVKANKLRRVSPGEYTITPIGEADVQKSDAEKT